uniref:Large ribosomal subunit protein uL15 n=1 Tax=uncultured marine group II euryarchaeote KM3-72-G3 TaxID=526683 RepID=B3V5I8_9ARCH|nr:ribosomal protein L15 [uncultured marine group II euryarchaeote KM3-72-G3]
MVSRTNKFRGRSRYHGRGKKAGRGAGKRGGRGNAGINKHRLMTRLKYMPGHWGMYGFNRHPSLRNVNVSINLQQVQELAEGDSIDLSEMGYDKLLGKGRIDRAINITVAEASARAIEKVEAAGGSVTVGEDGDDDRDEWEEE